MNKKIIDKIQVIYNLMLKLQDKTSSMDEDNIALLKLKISGGSKINNFTRQTEYISSLTDDCYDITAELEGLLIEIQKGAD